MSISRNSAIAALGVLLAFYGCKTSDPEPSPNGEGGESGEASSGKGGSSGSAGTANSGGKSGASPGGSSGQAGADAGAGGEATGTGGSASGAAGTGTTGGSGAQAGEGGAGGEAGAGDTGPDGLIVKQIAAGDDFTCALTRAGGVKCWGQSNSGSLGSSLSGRTAVALDVPGATSGVKRISAGDYHACAIKEDDHIVCWGFNEYDQLAIDPSLPGSIAPVPLSGFTGIVESVGIGTHRHSCLVDDLGGIRCWGLNSSYQLGVTTPATSSSPIQVAALSSGFVAVMAGEDHTCGLTTQGGVKCWGSNRFGQVGNGAVTSGTTLPIVTPVDVVGLASGVRKLGGGDWYSCVLTQAGGVKCWGNGGAGRLGNGTTLDQTSNHQPVDVTGLEAGVSDLASAHMHSCALMAADGSVRCWGYNQNGQLGNNPPTIPVGLNSSVPVAVVGLSGAITVGVGNTQSCAAMATGGVECWGSPWASGSTSSTNQLTPHVVEGF